jgi:hypothetical protein
MRWNSKVQPSFSALVHGSFYMSQRAPSWAVVDEETTSETLRRSGSCRGPTAWPLVLRPSPLNASFLHPHGLTGDWSSCPSLMAEARGSTGCGGWRWHPIIELALGFWSSGSSPVRLEGFAGGVVTGPVVGGGMVRWRGCRLDRERWARPEGRSDTWWTPHGVTGSGSRTTHHALDDPNNIHMIDIGCVPRKTVNMFLPLADTNKQ